MNSQHKTKVQIGASLGLACSPNFHGGASVWAFCQCGGRRYHTSKFCKACLARRKRERYASDPSFRKTLIDRVAKARGSVPKHVGREIVCQACGRAFRAPLPTRKYCNRKCQRVRYRDKASAQERDYRAEHKNEIRERARRWRNENREQWRAKSRLQHQRKRQALDDWCIRRSLGIKNPTQEQIAARRARIAAFRASKFFQIEQSAKLICKALT